MHVFGDQPQQLLAVRAHSSHLKVICRARPVVKSISGPHKQHFFRWSVQLARKVLQALPSITFDTILVAVVCS